MKIIFYIKLILISLYIFLNSLIAAYSENLEKLYNKIDLFSEVLEKIQDEYVHPKVLLTIYLQSKNHRLERQFC